MKNSAPHRVSIGLPVYNGGNYLEEVLDSLLGQTYSEFELIVSDNASTDITPDICRAYAALDSRVRYYRNSENIGATQNWYRTLDLSTSEYFAGAAHDDVYHPRFLEACVSVLDQNPSVVVCYAKTRMIDERGSIVRDFDVEIDTASPRASVRFYNMIRVQYLCIQMYGVMRTSVLRNTKVYCGYYGCDRNTLAELSLLGKVYELPEHLFFHRIHSQALGAALYSGKSDQELRLLDPGTSWNYWLSTLIRFRHYIGAITRLPLSPTERVLCYGQLIRFLAVKSAGAASRYWQSR